MNTKPNLTHAADSTAQFKVEQYSSLQLSPFGEFPHAKGIQLVDLESAQTIISNFNSFLARLGRRFAGVPIYIGHPDVPGYENVYTDHRAYGWIMSLQIEENALVGIPKWSKTGEELIGEAHYKFLSPFWEAAEAGLRNGRKLFRPHTLISAGLTNSPNLPMLPISNAREHRRGPSVASGRRRFIGFSVPQSSFHEETDRLPGGDGTGESGSNFDPAYADASVEPAHAAADFMQNANKTTNTQTGEVPATLANVESSLARLQNSYGELDARLADLNHRLLHVLVENAVMDGRIMPTERQYWMGELNRDFSTRSVDLANAERVVKVGRRGEDHARSTAELQTPAGRNKFLQERIREKMAKGLTYDESWQKVKEEHPAVFDLMTRPEVASLPWRTLL